MILGLVGILAAILLVLAVKNIHREKEFMTRALLSQANLLVRSLEASSRTGMMGMGWGNRQLQLLMEETAQQQDVLSIAMMNSSGRVIAHSDPAEVGKTLSVNLPEAGETAHRFSGEGEKSFEVVKSYEPWYRPRGGGNWDMWCSHNRYQPDQGLFIVVGLDPAPFDEALRQDLRQNILLFGIMFLVGAAGLLSIVWAQHYRNARCSLQEMRAFTTTIVNQMPVGLITTDLGGKIQKINEAARRILKYPEDFAGNIHDLPCFIPLADRLGKEETLVEQELRCLIDDEGAAVPVLVNAAVIRGGEDQTTGHAFLFTDMTNIKQLEEQLRRSERLASLGRLAAGVAHEIRNPLSSIKGFATILAGRFKEDGRSRQIADVMVQEVARLNRVVSELLDFARPTELDRRMVSFADLLRRSIKLVEGDASHRGVRVDLAVHPENLESEVDPDRFSQILLNLYLNALHAMENGGTLDIEALEGSGEVILTVSDSGSGISPEHLPHVFDPYFTTKPQGVGLGLANVHKFVEAHNGEIEVESTAGKGTTFTIRLPSSQRKEAVAGSFASVEARGGQDGPAPYAIGSHGG
jgi:two-component system sensor histidine kinase HydH